MKAIKIIGKIFLGMVLLLIVAAIVLYVCYLGVKSYNEKFPEKYISENYPDAEILEHGYTGGFLFDKGNLYYQLLDKKSGIKFEQEFSETGFLGILKPCENSYKQKLAQQEVENELIDDAESVLEAEHFIIHNPLDTMGIVIFTKNESAENVDSLMQTLNKSITEMRYVDYTIISCGEGLYEKVSGFDFSHMKNGKSGQCDFFDIADAMELTYSRITSKRVDTLDYQTYNESGDPADDEYISPESFDETAVCIIGEFNAIGDQHMSVFGVEL